MGFLLLALCILLLLALGSYEPGDVRLLQTPPHDPCRNLIGPAGAWTAFAAFLLWGVSAWVGVAALAGLGAVYLFCPGRRLWPFWAGWAVVQLAAVCLADLHSSWWISAVENLNCGLSGGVLGHAMCRQGLIMWIGPVGTGLVCWALLLAALIVVTGVKPVSLMRSIWSHGWALSGKIEKTLVEQRDRREQIQEEQKKIEQQRKRLERVVKKKPILPDPEPATELPLPTPKPEPVAFDPVPPAPRKPKKKKKATPKDDAFESAPPPRISSEYELPSLDLLSPLSAGLSRDHRGIQATATVLQETLSEFGIDAQVTNAEQGPVVTRYEVLPAAGVRVERIAKLSNNLALAMKAISVRVQAPIPGKGVVGIEIPNRKTAIVGLREIMESPEWKNSKAAVPLVIGKNVGGQVLISDLASMPHLLIAGATGSGKTVCMNSLLAGMLMSRTPDQLRLMLVDPKIVEFSGFNHLPHLVVPVITDAKKVSLGLRWAINEMENRYKLFARAGVRNITAFNSRPKQPELFSDGELTGNEPEPIPDTVPHIVIVVDELADLMLVAQAEIENSIARLAQLSRAVGIHMILATQRPSVNVITGTIKANIPCRIAFQTAQGNDSKTILDSTGAEKLLGKGDMLFLPPGTAKLIRSQGCLTDDDELRRIIAHVKQQGEPEFELEIKDKIESKTTELPDMGEDDELLEQAVEVIRQTHRASTSSLQRRLRIGYTRAARLMDQLEEKGIVGPPCGSDPREILIDLDGEIPQNT